MYRLYLRNTVVNAAEHSGGDKMSGMELFRREENAIQFQEGTTIFSEGDTGDHMYVVVEGEVELFVRGTKVERLEPGGIFGEMALLGHEPRSATAVAGPGCKIAPIDEKRFLFLVQQTPYFAIQLMRVLADRLRRMDLRL
jgi:CRP-like cAMP-binding protein